MVVCRVELSPKDYKRWHDLIFNLVKHCIGRYGRREVETWYWELWNEPDIWYWSGSFDEFCKLYDFTVAAVVQALPEARIGGPSTTGPGGYEMSAEWLDRFLCHRVNGINFFSGSKGTRLDFISFHAKGASFQPSWGRSAANTVKQFPLVGRILQQVRSGLDIVGRYPQLKGVECVLSECDTDGMAAYGRFDNSNLDFRNTEYFPSFVAATFKKLADLARGYDREIKALTWAFMFEGERCFEGTRTLTTYGIEKPILNLFRMYSLLGDKRVFLRSSASVDPLSPNYQVKVSKNPEIDGIATTSGNDDVGVLLFCHHDNWEIEDEYEVEIEIANISSKSNLLLRHFRIDKYHSNAHTEWVRLGSPDYPTTIQKRKIVSKQGLEFYEPIVNVEPKNGSIKKKITLPVHGISLLTLDAE